MTLTGLFAPLVTPFNHAGELDTNALTSLATTVLDNGADGLVALGTTGEPDSLSGDERRRVADICLTVCRERGAALVVGAGTNNTNSTISAVATLDPAISAVLTVVPYYTRPTADGVVEHFRRVAQASPVPLIVYNVPARTGITLDTTTLLRLAHLPNVIGFKHAVGAIDATTITFLANVPPDMAVLAGDDLYAGALAALGAAGAIMAGANVAPRAYADLIQAWRGGECPDAMRRQHQQLVPLTGALFAEPNPTVIKGVLARRGLIESPHVRLPLLPATPAAIDTAIAALALTESPHTDNPILNKAHLRAPQASNRW